MDDLVALSSRIIDEGLTDTPFNRMTQKLAELSADLAMVESFSHVVALKTGAGLVLFDTSHYLLASDCVREVRKWSSVPICAMVYTHGHVDHVGGSGAFAADCERRGEPQPRVIGHEHVSKRFERYRLTNGYNLDINRRQFGQGAIDMPENFLPQDVLSPSEVFRNTLAIEVGDELIELRHALGETDDSLWAWLPQRKAIFAGDFFIWNFPNCGNPQKAQRYPREWAAALREMAALGPELLVPAHGLPIGGQTRIAMVLDETASLLESVVEQTLSMMNAGEPLDAILHSIKIDSDLLARPYLRPLYDEPEFVIRNLWRLYGGWYDGNPAHLKPAPMDALSAELASLCGGAKALAARARQLCEAGQLRLACHLVEHAAAAAPEDREVHGARAEIYTARRQVESSLMAKGIYGDAARRSTLVADPDANIVGKTAQKNLRI